MNESVIEVSSLSVSKRSASSIAQILSIEIYEIVSSCLEIVECLLEISAS